jgi:hypothetical protein
MIPDQGSRKSSASVDVFVYPFGSRSPVTVRTVREAGYRYAMTVEGGPADLSLMRGSGLTEMPRYLLTRSGARPFSPRLPAAKPAPAVRRGLPPERKSQVQGMRALHQSVWLQRGSRAAEILLRRRKISLR